MPLKKSTIGRLFVRSCFRIVTWITFCATFGLASLLILLFYYGRGLPDHTVLSTHEPILSNRIYYGDDQLWRDYAKERRLFVPLELIPDNLTHAFLVAEDKHFFLHPGVDLLGVFRAFVKNTLAGKWRSRPMGASTITQQVAKNMLLSNERSFGRKIKEAILALRIENTLSKRRILELYLNHIYLGSGCYGITAAAEHYFKKSLDMLSVEEVAFLAGLPKAPETYQPHKSPNIAKSRRDWVLERLFEENIINSKDFLKAQQAPITTLSKRITEDFEGDYFLEASRQKLIELVGEKSYAQGGYFLWTTVDPPLQKMAHITLQKGLEEYEKRYGYQGALAHVDLSQATDLSSTTEDCSPQSFEKQQALFLNHIKTLKISVPGHLFIAMVNHVDNDEADILLAELSSNTLKKEKIFLKDMLWAKHPSKTSPTQCHDIVSAGDIILVRRAPEQEESTQTDHYVLSHIPRVTGGMVVMNKHTGHILALSGGYHFGLNQFNNATQAMRQPGSAFKPFVYLAALERGYSKQSRILDAPITIPLGFRDNKGRTTYSPRNYTRRYYGMTTLEDGLAHSRNVMTVRLAMQMGMRPIQHIVKKLGLYDDLPRQLAMTLGAGETTLLKLTTAYAMISNGGYRVYPTFFHRIEDRHGSPLYSHERWTNVIQDTRERIASESAINDLQDMMHQVVQKGTAKSTLRPIAEKYNVSIFGKTGTTNDYKDAWVVCSVEDIVVGIFVGFPTPKTLGDGQTGGRVAAPIAASFIDHYLSFIKKEEDVANTSLSFDETPDTEDTDAVTSKETTEENDEDGEKTKQDNTDNTTPEEDDQEDEAENLEKSRDQNKNVPLKTSVPTSTENI